MRVPLSWLREHVELPESVTARQVADALVRAGLEVETVESVGRDLVGPLVVGRVLRAVDETHSNGKTVRWCRVDVGGAHNDPAEGKLPAGRGIVCGAHNFTVDDLVVVSLPGAVLPGGFAIGARTTYGHVSDGMICSARELAMGEDHDGIIVLPRDAAAPGDDAVALLGLVDDVLDIAVTPDRGYCLSVRGVAREVATAFDRPFDDPAGAPEPADDEDWPVNVLDVEGCDRFVMRSVTDFDTRATSPLWLQRRLQLAGMRPISLAVDVTNYVMLELGQPLHAYDRSLLKGPIVVRAAVEGEQLRTLDDTARTLSTDDLLITDDTGPIGMAGVMGGATTEIGPDSTSIAIEAAHFAPTRIARAARRHRLPSEASRRFERGVDDRLQEAAADRAVGLLAQLGRATVLPGRTVVDAAPPPPVVSMGTDLPSRLVGHEYSVDDVVGSLRAIGAQVELEAAVLRVTAPSWRPDLRLPVDLVEEVARLHGYDAIPSVLPQAPAGRGLTAAQRLRRRVGLVLAGQGYVEVQAYPFVSGGVGDELMWGADDARRPAARLANPLSDEEPFLRTSLLPGLLATVRRNVGRGFDDLALFETGSVFRPRPATAGPPPRLGTAGRPTDDQVAALDALIPHQPRHVATAACGLRQPAGWWGPGQPVAWGDAVESARVVAAAAGLALTARPDQHPPWHPGRCAALLLDGEVVGHAGELHPRVVAALGLPARSVAMELDLDAVTRKQRDVAPAPEVGTYPVAKEDVALVVSRDVDAAAVRSALVDGVEHHEPRLLESVRLFDVYEGEQIEPGHRSLAFALRLRAADRTLTVAEVTAARDAAVAEAGRRTGAVLRA
jgi:phenylalanyl-tRNA synthetase beta chain